MQSVYNSKYILCVCVLVYVLCDQLLQLFWSQQQNGAWDLWLVWCGLCIPLHKAAKEDGAVQVLLMHGAYIEARSFENLHSPLHRPSLPVQSHCWWLQPKQEQF